MPLVSVVMPVRNAASTIDAAVRSICDQTFGDWELVSVDDGSDDGTLERLSDLARLDPRIRTLTQPRAGIVPALTRGLDAARGELIARMDADDIAHCERFEEQIGFLRKNPGTGLVGSLVRFGGDPATAQGFSLHVEWLNSLVSPEEIELNRFVESPLAHPSVMFRRRLLARFGGYRNGDFPEDYELWLRWMDAGVRAGKVARPLLVWNDPPGRLSRNDSRYAVEAFYALKAVYLSRAVERTRNGRDVWVWGAGRPTRKRAGLLELHGTSILGYIEIDPRKAGKTISGKPVRCPAGMPGPESAMALAYVGSRGAREQIRAELTIKGFREGRDFWVAA